MTHVALAFEGHDLFPIINLFLFDVLSVYLGDRQILLIEKLLSLVLAHLDALLTVVTALGRQAERRFQIRCNTLVIARLFYVFVEIIVGCLVGQEIHVASIHIDNGLVQVDGRVGPSFDGRGLPEHFAQIRNHRMRYISFEIAWQLIQLLILAGVKTGTVVSILVVKYISISLRGNMHFRLFRIGEDHDWELVKSIIPVLIFDLALILGHR